MKTKNKNIISNFGKRLTLKSNPKAKVKKKILGRGVGSGRGGSSTRGLKGYKSWSGNTRPYIGFEGGQTPLYRKVPKRGRLKPNSKKKYMAILNIQDLEKYFMEGENVTPAILKKKKIIQKKHCWIKILSIGELTKKLTIYTHAISSMAQKKLKKNGSNVIILKPNLSVDLTAKQS